MPSSVPLKDQGKDFSLKEGEMISINIPGVTSKKTTTLASGPGGGLKKLAPPPGSKKLAPPTSFPPPASNTFSGPMDVFGGAPQAPPKVQDQLSDIFGEFQSSVQ
jgi:hypothetical protein